MPFNDKWTLNWKNPSSMIESYGPALELKYTVEILNQPPAASIKADGTSGPVPLTISFLGAGLDYNGVVNSYYWVFGDGAGTSTEQNPIYTYANPGEYTVELTVTDDDGATGKDTVIIIVKEP